MPEAQSKKPLISVVIPSYNDEAVIRPFYEAVVDVFKAAPDYDFEIIYIDDGSVDGSTEILEQLAREEERVTYIEFYRNYGQQRALFAGLKESRGDYVVTIDGDYQYDPSVIIQLTEALEEGYELASGIRKIRMDGLLSVISSKIGNLFINKAIGIKVGDFGAVKAFDRKLVDRIISREHHFSDVYPAAFSLGPKMIEKEVDHKARPVGESHWNLWMRIKLYLDLYISHGDSQFDLPFKIGVISSLTGPLVAVLFLAYKAFFGHDATILQILFYSFIVLLLGINLIAWSLMMTFQLRVYKQNISANPYTIRKIMKKEK